MKEQEDKYLDDLAKKVVKNAPMAFTSNQFTDSIMSEIKNLNAQQAVQYKPLISKRTWAVVFIFITFIVLINLCFQEVSDTPKWVTSIKLNNPFENLFQSGISKSMTYAIITLGFMICIQVFYLRQYFTRRLKDY